MRAKRGAGGRRRLLGRSKGGLTSKLHVLADAMGRPIATFLSAGYGGEYVGAVVLLPVLPPGAKVLVADRGYAADWVRRGLAVCIPARRCRKAAPDPILHRQRHRIENAFARLKDRRRIATRGACPRAGLRPDPGDRRPDLVLSA